MAAASKDNNTQTRVVETEQGNVSVTTPKTTAKHRSKVTVLLEPDELVRGQVGGFVHFLQDYAVVGLALGFIVGQQANGVVKQFVASFIDPLFTIWFGQNLSTRTALLHHHQTIVRVPWGSFVYTLSEFFFVLISIYVLIKLFKLDRFAAKNGKK